MDEKEVVNLIKNKKHSRLSFLEDERKLVDNDDYYGFLYFLLESKNEDKKDILEKISNIYGGLFYAYLYLGDVALKIYSTIYERHVPESFFRAATELDRDNSDAWWGIYRASRDLKSFLESLKIDYKNKNIKAVKDKLKNTMIDGLNLSGYSNDEWNFLIKILLDKEILSEENTKKYLLHAYLNLNLIDEGVDLIHKMDKVNVDILIKYYRLGKIDKKTSLSKLYFFETDKFLEGDSLGIYEEYLKESLKGEANPTKSVLILKAFKARRFWDVIKHYRDGLTNNIFLHYDFESRIYLLLSQIQLKIDLDEEALKYILNKHQLVDKEYRGLYKAFCLSRILDKLKNQYDKNNYFHHDIAALKSYQDAEQLLEDSELLNHFLYNELFDELEGLREKWDNEHFKYRFEGLRNNNSELYFTHESLMEFCTLGVKNKHYKEVVDKINEYHEKSPSTIYTYNALGVCFDKLASQKKAFEYFEKAVELMEKYKEFDYSILANYIQHAKENSFLIPDDRFEKLQDDLNINLVESCKWSPLIGNRLYKYYPLNVNTIDSLINGYFYFPQKNQLNDPIEFPELDGIGKKDIIHSDYRICSFSKNKNSVLMWSHYTKNHEGLMVEFQFKGELSKGVGIAEVKYTDGGKRNRDQDKYIFNQFLLTKNNEWSYEEEVRLLSYKNDKVFYEKYNYPYHDKNKINAQILSITLGCNFPESKIELIKNIVETMNKNRYEHEENILLRKAIISKSNIFSLEYINL
ncbi:DUF2971 domain-containing protein [Dickeya chrysanthemi]|uniref:DUF2971 domain-containing protein n=1 Tax=Dickeya chrysanthemi TaxID=556 RepID=A0ABU8JNX7_DICCH